MQCNTDLFKETHEPVYTNAGRIPRWLNGWLKVDEKAEAETVN